jgi:hypothetical protein
METLYTIEKGIEVPVQRKDSVWAKLSRSMEVGDSVLVKTRIEAMNLYNALVRHGFKAITRSEKDQIRVWKANKQ